MTNRRLGALAAALVLSAATAACGSPTVDYSSIVTSGTTSAAGTETSTTPTPIAEYLTGRGVTGEQVSLGKLTNLTVTLPRPPGWTKYANPNFSPGTEAIAKNNTYPTAMVMVFTLNGNFDVPAALKHAGAGAEMSKDFTKLNFSEADFNGFPSSMIEGSYELNGTRMHSYNRIVIPVTPAPTFQRYLIQLTVTTLANKAAAAAPDVQQVIDGFGVAVKQTR